MATVNAILNGRLTWSDHTNPEAFSIFACFKPGPSNIGTTQDDFLALQLKSLEGQGLSEADVIRSTKVTFRAPQDEHQLGEFIGAFSLVLTIIMDPTPSSATPSGAGSPTSAHTKSSMPNNFALMSPLAARCSASLTELSSSTSVPALTMPVGQMPLGPSPSTTTRNK
jgi:hypothetical protein